MFWDAGRLLLQIHACSSAVKNCRAKVIKQGSVETTDLALLSIDETRLPISLQLRRNPLCKEPPKAGENVIVVVTHGIARSQILWPRLLPPSERANFATFIADVWIPGGSGSGVFHAERKCLLGIIITRLTQDNYSLQGGRIVRDLARSTVDAKHFVPADKDPRIYTAGISFLISQSEFAARLPHAHSDNSLQERPPLGRSLLDNCLRRFYCLLLSRIRTGVLRFLQHAGCARADAPTPRHHRGWCPSAKLLLEAVPHRLGGW